MSFCPVTDPSVSTELARVQVPFAGIKHKACIFSPLSGMHKGSASAFLVALQPFHFQF